MRFKFKRGDICITQNTDVKLLNDGLVVRVVWVDPTRFDHRGEPNPYLIERVDGEAFPNTCSETTGTPSWYKLRAARCAEYKLRRYKPDEPSAAVHREEAREVELTV